ncbi:MAG: DUF262 domain-containing protein [Clostridium sp.]
MKCDAEKLRELSLKDIFKNARYEVPIYQRNYTWTEKEIEQLIEDIESVQERDYYLGNLIVNKKDENLYEVIDGQQRLTTTYLLQKYLGMKSLEARLIFETREKSNRTLKMIGVSKDFEEEDNIILGYKIIEAYFKNKKIEQDKFIEKLEKVKVIRVQVPDNTDLNEYFEIMNTRGEQLELHEIAKARILKVLPIDDKEIGSLIWEACEDMDSYVQMNFKKDIREKVFSDDWSELREDIDSFDKIKDKIDKKDGKQNIRRTLGEILKGESQDGEAELKEDEGNERFESITSFPNFILQINKINSETTIEVNLDDKNFIENIKDNWKDEGNAKRFLYKMLQCRVLLDKYIIKRETTSKYEKGRWVLQKLNAYTEKGGAKKPQYKNTFGENELNEVLVNLQSCLRVTYTSPKAMGWIHILLKELLEDEKRDIKDILEAYCESKLDIGEEVKGFGFERIVFTYLDYILYRDGYSYDGKKIIAERESTWEFTFRNSIEHFYPQNPMGGDQDRWEDRDLNGFGNLALITVSGNSKLSNMPPSGKVDSNVFNVNQSLKLKVMVAMMGESKKWDKNISNKHKEEMFKLLNAEMIKKNEGNISEAKDTR